MASTSPLSGNDVSSSHLKGNAAKTHTTPKKGGVKPIDNPETMMS